MVESVVQSHAEIVVGSAEKKLIRVLHVDDELGLLKVAKQCLELQGPFHVDTPCSVEEALNKLKEEEYDAVVSDYKMPGKDGLEFLETLRKNGNTIPFIMFTGKGREEIAIKALNLGADRYVNKTGDPETVYCELGHAIRTTVERKQIAEARTRAEMSLRACGESYGRLFESTIEGILINGPDGKITSLNPAAANILGYSDPKQLIGTPAVELYANPEDRTRVLQELMKNGYAKDREITWKKKDGILIEILASVTVQKDEKGNMLRTEGIFRDVTEKKQAEKALRESEEKYRTLANSLPEIAFEANEQGKLTFVNERAYVITGYTQEDFAKGLNALDFPVPEHQGRAQENLKKALSGEKTGTNEYTFQRKDGSTFPVLISSSPVVHEDKIVGLRGIIVDISQFKKMEMRLSENQTRLQSVFDTSPNAILVIDLNGRIVDCNERAQEIFGYSSKSESVGRSALELIAEEDRQRAMESMERTLKQGLMRNIEYAIVAKDGSKRLLSATASVLRDVSRNPTGFVSAIEDITERKKAEEAVLAERDRLETVTRNIGAGLAIISKDYRTLWANDVLKQIFGDVEGKICYSTYNQRSGICPGCGVHEIFETGKAKVVHGQVGKGVDGKTVWSEITATPVKDRDGNITAVLELVVPITQRKRAEEELRDSEEKYKDLTESIENPFFAMDRDLRYTYWNKASEKLTGIKAKDAIGKSLTEVFPDVKGTTNSSTEA
jgi:PAS domain S-box-containing protein